MELFEIFFRYSKPHVGVAIFLINETAYSNAFTYLSAVDDLLLVVVEIKRLSSLEARYLTGS
jgi:hypothetical protein